MHSFQRALLLASALLALTPLLSAETGREAWLRYAPLSSTAAARYNSLPASVVALGDSPVVLTAQHELVRGLKDMLGRTLREQRDWVNEPAIVLATTATLKSAAPELKVPALHNDGFWITNTSAHRFPRLLIAGNTDRGVLYGVFTLLRKIAMGETLANIYLVQSPYMPVRWVDQWDNLNGTIERGYGGPSIFFENDNVRGDLTRAAEYARLLASLGIQGCAVNNVNANPRVIEDDFLPQLARLAAVFRPWGVRLSVSVDVSSPKTIGRLDTFDPLDPAVIAWWQNRVDKIYKQIPDFAGFVVKADSEGRLGPSSYGRTPADAANTIARALKPHAGILFYRAFVYDHHLDWTNPKADRARAAYDIFHPLDGKFEDNVIIQIKHGPIDFQAREPVSPLFGGLRNTNAAIELPVMQEYTGQQRHMVFLIPSWSQILNFDLGASTTVKDVISGRAFHRPAGGAVAVVNVGMDDNWFGNPMGMSNLYGFGRLAWDPGLTPQTIADEWIRLTFGSSPKVVQTLAPMLLTSWHTYESYTGPLGAQTLTDILGAHFGPGVESSERNGWGQWHRADANGIGMDRTVATGTGFAGQYAQPIARMYESLETTPDNLLLFFHHVPYTYVLHSGKTVIQHIYDSHYGGAQRVQDYVAQWKSLRGLIDDDRYHQVLDRLEFQADHAIVWRDAICMWFFRTSGIPDAHGRVGHYPDRVEAEAMKLEGYTPIDITPWENASAGKAIACSDARGCAASFAFDRKPGWYDVLVQYFDQNNGKSRFRVFVGSQLVDEWIAADSLPATRPGGDSSSRRHLGRLALRPGDIVRIEGTPDATELAPLDYVELRLAPQP
jgi:alpha-glucuronidase